MAQEQPDEGQDFQQGLLFFSSLAAGLHKAPPPPTYAYFYPECLFLGSDCTDCLHHIISLLEPVLASHCLFCTISTLYTVPVANCLLCIIEQFIISLQNAILVDSVMFANCFMCPVLTS